MNLNLPAELAENKLLILFIIFIIVFCAIFLFRIIFLFLLEQSYKKYLLLKKASKKILPSSRKKFEKEEEERLREKLDIPKANSKLKAELIAKRNQAQSGNYELIVSEEQELDRIELNKTQIVDIVKPIGFWTSMILGQKLTFLVQSAQMLNKRGDKGFWASMIEAKEREAGRQHSRGR